MGETRKPLSFGPSERYLPGKKLEVGDVLTMNILDFERNQIDTEYGSKFQFLINVLSSSTPVATPGKQIWRTVCNAAELLNNYLVKDEVAAEDYSTWVFRLTVVENGFRLDEIA